MPKVEDAKDIELHGVAEVENLLTMGERIRKRFRPHDTVRVMNIDNEMVEWQVLNEDDESFTMDEDIKIIERNRPELFRLSPGEEDILEGYQAYIMIEVLFKKMAIKKIGVNEHPLDEREIKNFSFDDPNAQEHMIDKIFLGKVSPRAMQEAALKSLEDHNAKSEKRRPAAA